jgi:hypothetical protein
MTKLSIAFLAAVAVVGCKKKEGASGGTSNSEPSTNAGSAQVATDAPTAGSAAVVDGPAPPAGPTNVVGTVGGEPLTFKHANVIPNDSGIGIQLFPSKVDCATRWADVYVAIRLPPGRDGRYFSGQTLPPQTTVYAAKGDDNRYDVTALSTLTLDEFELQEGGKIKGTLEVQHKRKDGDVEVKLAGRFEAEICRVPSPVDVPPVATTPATGKLGSASFTHKSAVLVMAHDEGNQIDHADTLYLYTKPGVNCDTDRTDRAKTGDHVRVWGFGGVSSKVKTTGAIIPANAGVEDKTGNMNLADANAWVQFDEVALEVNGPAKGTMMIDGGGRNGARVSGTFSAIVCK